MKTFKITLFLAVILASALSVQAQRARVSPHETTSGVIGERRSGCRVTLVYGRPHSKDRKIWGGLVPYGEPWRMGADEATTLITEQTLTFGDLTVPAGAYTLYMVPSDTGASKLVFSSHVGQWGVPVDTSHDVGRVDLKKEGLDKPVDQFTMAVANNSGAGGGTLKMMWETNQFSVGFSVKK